MDQAHAHGREIKTHRMRKKRIYMKNDIFRGCHYSNSLSKALLLEFVSRRLIHSENAQLWWCMWLARELGNSGYNLWCDHAESNFHRHFSSLNSFVLHCWISSSKNCSIICHHLCFIVSDEGLLQYYRFSSVCLAISFVSCIQLHSISSDLYDTCIWLFVRFVLLYACVRMQLQLQRDWFGSSRLDDWEETEQASKQAVRQISELNLNFCEHSSVLLDRRNQIAFRSHHFFFPIHVLAADV